MFVIDSDSERATVDSDRESMRNEGNCFIWNSSLPSSPVTDVTCIKGCSAVCDTLFCMINGVYIGMCVFVG